MTQQITFTELMEAYGTWRHLTRSPKNKNTTREFFLFLGENEDSDVMAKVYAGSNIPNSVILKIKWLNSPNAKTLYEAWKAKQC